MAFRGVCSIIGCGKPAVNSRGWCPAHYQRWRKHGSPRAETPFGTAPGERLKFLEDVALAHKGKDCLLWPYSGVKGYGEVTINGRSRLAHRVICERVNGPAPTPKHEAAHSCGKGNLGCVNPHHLSWKTPKENQADKLLHGTHNRGERQGASKITTRDAKEIKRLRGIVTQAELARRYGVTRSHICKVQSGNLWGWL